MPNHTIAPNEQYKQYKTSCSLPEMNPLGVHYYGEGCFLLSNYKKGGAQWNTDKVFSIQDASTRYYLLQQINRFVMPHLKQAERAMFLFIFDRTIGWGKEREKIKKNHFLLGIDGITDGTGLTKPTINKALESLVSVGIIGKLGDFYTINWNGLIKWLETQTQGVKKLMFREPKKGKKPLPNMFKTGKKTLPLIDNNSSKEDLIEDNNAVDTDHVNVEQKFSVQNKHDLENLISLSVKEKQKRFLEKQRTKKALSLLDYQKMWHETVGARYPHVAQVMWSKKTLGQIKHFLKAVSMPDGKTHADFLEFCVNEWSGVGVHHFGWLNNYRLEQGQPSISFPQYPCIGFVMGFKQVFLNAYTKHIEGLLYPRDIKKQKLKAQGYTDEEVLKLTSVDLEIQHKTDAHKKQLEALTKKSVVTAMHEQQQSRLSAFRSSVKQKPVIDSEAASHEDAEAIEYAAKQFCSQTGNDFAMVYETFKTFGVDQGKAMFV